MCQNKDSIVAVATGSGAGGLGVIRASGSLAKALISRIFLPRYEDTFVLRPRYMHYGSFILWRAFMEDGQKNLPLDIRLNGSPEFCVQALQGDSADFSEGFDIAQKYKQEPENYLILDEILLVYFPAPHSYTGEEVVEIHAHGSSLLLQSMAEYISLLGFRQAEAGEFTKRAFLNGRMDLSQAEAVAEMIAAPALEGIRLAAAKLHGVLGRKIEGLRDQLEYIRRRLCLAIDFPEEEGECLPTGEFHALVGVMSADIQELILAYDRAKPWQEGCLVVLAGQVNAGKSSLMNAILGRKRAIVTAEAGTTRDYLEESTSLNGLPIRLTDTAGLREIAQVLQKAQEHQEQNQENSLSDGQFDDLAESFSLDFEMAERLSAFLQNEETGESAPKTTEAISPIELEGIYRSLELMQRADLVFLVFDGQRLLQEAESTQENSTEFVAKIANCMQAELALLKPETKVICLWNKADEAPLSQESRLALQERLSCPVFCLCAKAPHKGHNEEKSRHELKDTSQTQSIDELASFAQNLLSRQDISQSEIAPNRRQVSLLRSALQELNLLDEEIDFLPPDITAVRLASCAQFLEGITGLSSVDETFNAIFEEFCIGK